MQWGRGTEIDWPIFLFLALDKIYLLIRDVWESYLEQAYLADKDLL